jgi:nucleoside-diphosphate kinase
MKLRFIQVLFLSALLCVIKITHTELTLALIKPDAVKSGATGQIITTLELNKFTIKALKKTQLTCEQAQKFYATHKNKPFFKDLVNYIISGPLVAIALEKEHAIQDWRDLMGTTDPQQACLGTIRRMFGTSKTYNAAHGSDTQETAKTELTFFFPELKL